MIIISKNECSRCDEAVYFSKLHNISYSVEKLQNKYEIAKTYPDHEEQILSIKMYPIIFIPKKNIMVDFEHFKSQYGEIILNPNSDRYVLFPIQYPYVWNMYEKTLASFWTVAEIDFQKDEHDWTNVLNTNEKHFIKNILAFFASADGIVNENLAVNFSDEVQIPEARAFYSYQQFNETIHSQTYSIMIDRFVSDPHEKQRLFKGMETIESVRDKANWALKWINKKNCVCFAKRLVGFACVEGIMFSGSFCAIFWLKKRGLMHGLSFSNELIARDEGTHQDFAVLLYSMLKNKLSTKEVIEIITDAVHHEKKFINDSISCNLIGMNTMLMSQYIEYVADRLLLQLGYKEHYGSKNPFDFMENISLTGKTNFFERRVGEYAKAGHMVEDPYENVFVMDEEF